MKAQPKKSNWPDGFDYANGCKRIGDNYYSYYPNAINCYTISRYIGGACIIPTHGFKLKSWKMSL